MMWLNFCMPDMGLCEVAEWQWLISYSTALRTCEALTQRAELPTPFISLHTEAGQLEENRNVLVSLFAILGSDERKPVFRPAFEVIKRSHVQLS